MMTGRHIPAVLAVLAGYSVAGCNLPDPDFQGKMHEEASPSLTRPEILAGVLTRVAGNAETAGDYETAELFYRRAHKMGAKNVQTALGLARSLAAMNEPLAASDAYGAALAIDEHNEEAVAGLAKTLEMVAANSAKNRPADMPPPPAVARAAPASVPGSADEPAMSDKGIEGAIGDSEPTDPSTETGGEMAQDGDTGAAPPTPMMEEANDQAGEMAKKSPEGEGAMGALPSPESATANPEDAAARTGTIPPAAAAGDKVKLNDVLSAIEWKADKAATVPGGVPQAVEPEGVQTADTTPTTMPPMTTDGKAPATASPMAGTPMVETPAMSTPAATSLAPPAGAPTDYRLQFGAFGSAPRAEAARNRIGAKAKKMLGDVALQVDRVDSGAGKKPIYKLRSGGVGNRSNAAVLCARLKAQSIGCFLVKPTGANAMPANPPRKAALELPAPSKPAAAAMAGGTVSAAPLAAKKDPVIGWEVVDDLNKNAASGSTSEGK